MLCIKIGISFGSLIAIFCPKGKPVCDERCLSTFEFVNFANITDICKCHILTPHRPLSLHPPPVPFPFHLTLICSLFFISSIPTPRPKSDPDRRSLAAHLRSQVRLQEPQAIRPIERRAASIHQGSDQLRQGGASGRSPQGFVSGQLPHRRLRRRDQGRKGRGG